MKKLLLLVFSAALLAWLLAPQWRSFDAMGERRFQALAHMPKEIVVGICWPFSINQDGMGDGLQLALEEINAHKIAGGIPMRLVLRDDRDDWDRAKRIAIEFSETPEMSAVVGYYDDGKAIKASTMYESSRLLHIMVGVNAAHMTAHGLQYILRTIVASDKIARALARISAARGYKKFAMVWEREAFGEDLAYQFHVAMDAQGAQLVYQTSYDRDHDDFRLTVNQLKGVDADFIFLSGLEPWAGDFVAMATEVGLKTQIIGAFSDTPDMRAHAGPGIEGSMLVDFYDVNSPTPENQAFVATFRHRFGRLPDTWAAQGYDALRMLAGAVRATGSANPLDLSYALRYMDPYEGANGRYKFDGQGELEDKPIYLYVVRGNSSSVVQASPPPPPVTPDAPPPSERLPVPSLTPHAVPPSAPSPTPSLSPPSTASSTPTHTSALPPPPTP